MPTEPNATPAADACVHNDWEVTGQGEDLNPPKLEVTCRTCGATQMVGDYWLMTHQWVKASMIRMIRPVEEVL